jgi:hypothetical protein
MLQLASSWLVLPTRQELIGAAHTSRADWYYPHVKSWRLLVTNHHTMPARGHGCVCVVVIQADVDSVQSGAAAERK